MKLFIKLSSLFVFLLFGLIILISISTSLIEKRYASFSLKNNPKYIVVGHSHPECAFNDSLIPNFKNISRSGESYFYNYFKTKQVILQNKSITTVFIQYTNNQINKGVNVGIWGNKYISNSFPKYSSFMSLSDNLLLFKNNPIGYINTLSVSEKKKFNRILKKDFNYSKKIGGYLYLERDKTDSILNATTKTKNKPASKDTAISEANLSYLDALIKFCKKNGIQVILIRSPQHKKSHRFSNEKKYLKILETRYANIEYLDFSHFLLSNSEFGDLNHLNHKGAKVFSEWFANLLDNGLLVKENKQDYIDEQIKKRTNNTFNN